MSFSLTTQPQSETRLIARVYSLCARMTGDSGEAEDLAQETFLQLFRRISTFRNESAFATWLHRVTVNVVLMHRRRKRVQLVPFEQPELNAQGPVWREYGAEDQRLSGLIDRIVIRRAIRRLPEGRQAVLVLHDLEGYLHSEIAQLQDCSIGNSKSQLSRARWSMRELLQSVERHSSQCESTPKRGKARGHQAGRLEKERRAYAY